MMNGTARCDAAHILEYLDAGLCRFAQRALIRAIVARSAVAGAAAIHSASIRQSDSACIDEIGTVFGAVAVDDDSVANLQIAFLPTAAG